MCDIEHWTSININFESSINITHIQYHKNSDFQVFPSSGSESVEHILLN